MIFRGTALDDAGVRHIVFILSGYPVGTTICAFAIKRAGLDKTYEAPTCMACIGHAERLEHGAK